MALSPEKIQNSQHEHNETNTHTQSGRIIRQQSHYHKQQKKKTIEIFQSKCEYL